MLFSFRNKETVSKSEEKKVREVFSRLIVSGQGTSFIFPKFEKKNTKKIGNIILENYLEITKTLLKRRLKLLSEYTGNTEKYNELLLAEKEITEELFDLLTGKKERNLEYIEELFAKIKDYFAGFGPAYYELSFAPSVTEMTRGFNCFGFTQIIGALYLKAGFDVKLCISVNHPMCLIEHDGEILIISNYGIDKISKKIFNPDNKPVPYFIDLTGQVEQLKNEDFMDEKSFVVTEFAEGVLYEYLENLSSMKAVEKQEESLTLPLNVLHQDEVVQFLGNDILEPDFHKMQVELFPEIRKLFDKNSERFLQEFDKFSPKYDEMLYFKFLNSFIDRFLEITYNELELEERKGDVYNYKHITKKALRVDFLKHKKEILEYVYESKPFDDNFPEFLKRYIEYIFSEIRKIEIPHIKAGIINYYLKNLNEDNSEKENQG